MADDGFKIPSLIHVKSSKNASITSLEKNHPKDEMESDGLSQQDPSSERGNNIQSTHLAETMDTNTMGTDSQLNTSKSDSQCDLESPRQPEAPPPVPYTVPHWSGECREEFSLLVIKNGVAMDTVQFKGKSHILFGRLAGCDVRLEHPSISRYHAIIQFKPVDTSSIGKESTASKLTTTHEAGFYVYDLGSTHGTYLNKHHLNPRVYYRLRVGQMVKFGGSSRIFILESPGGGQAAVQEEAENEIQDISQQEQLYKKTKLEQAARDMEQKKKLKKKEEEGVMWGMDYDFDMESETIYNPDEVDPEREAYYKDDPKKALRKFFEREGLDLEYESEEIGQSYNKTFNVRVKLPIDMATGEAVYAEGSSKGKKKDAMVLCALDACRILDGYDMLRVSSQSHKRKQKNWENEDYYDSDEDTFLDRTGTVEKKRLHRMKRAGKIKDKAETFQSLKIKLESCQKGIDELEKTLEQSRTTEQSTNQGGTDTLESYMKTLGHHLTKSDKYEMRQKIHQMRKEEGHLLKLINIVRNPGTPEFKSTGQLVEVAHSSPEVHKPLPPHGKINKSQVPRHKSSMPVASTDQGDSSRFLLLKERIEQAKMREGREGGTSEDEDDEGDRTRGVVLPRRRTSSSGSEASQGNSPLTSPTAKKSRMIGPTLPAPPPPLGDPLSRPASSSDPSNSPPHHHEIKSTIRRDSTKTHEDKKTFITWLPPEGQSGDGRTHLNEKFGY